MEASPTASSTTCGPGPSLTVFPPRPQTGEASKAARFWRGSTAGGGTLHRAKDEPRFPFWLLIFVGLVSIAIIAGGVWLLVSQNRDIRKDVEDDLLSISQLKVSEIVAWRAERLANAADLGGNPTFGEAVAAWMTTKQASGAAVIVATLANQADLYNYSEAQLVDESGTVLLSTAQSPGAPETETLGSIKTAKQEHTSVLTDLHSDPDHPAIHLSAIAPVVSAGAASSEATVFVVLIADADQFLYPLISSWPVPSGSAETLLVRRDGDSVLFLNELRHESGTALKLREPLSNTKLPATMAVLGRQGIAIGKDYRGVEVLAALAPIPSSSWFIVAKIDTSEAFGPARVRLGLLGGLIGVLLLALLVGATLMWQVGLKHRYIAAHRAERAHHELLTRFEHLVKEANDAIILADEDGRIVELNDRAIETYGYSRAEFLGLLLKDLVPREEGGHFDERMREVDLSGSSIHQIIGRRKDGSLFPVEVSDRSFEIEGKPYVQAIIRDNTVRKKAESDVLASKERYRAMVEAVAQIVWVTGPAGEIVESLSTLQDYAGLTFESLQEEGLLAAVHPEDLDQVAAVWAHALANHTRFETECRMRRADGQYRDFWIRGAPSYGSDGEVAEWVGVCTDVTDRRRAEEERLKLEQQLQHSQRLESLGVLAGGIAHDFNNILTAVLGHADLTLQDLPLSSPGRQGVQEIVKASRRASELCRQMLAYSGHGQFIIEDIDLSRLIEDMLNLLSSAIPKKVLLNLNIGKNLPTIRGDVTQISQVIMNLVINAAEAIGERSGVITISVGAQECTGAYLDATYFCEGLSPGLFVTLEVSDTGIGMDKETLARLFEPFFTTKFTGRGLGLAAVLGIVRGHKGALKVYSEPGKGTTFKALFPAVGFGGGHLPATGESDEADWSGAGTVLLADDEETIRALGKRMLERLGFQVLLAADGRAALEMYALHRDEIVLVILDLTMPRMSGEEAFREMRQIDPKVRVLMSSGYAENDILSRFAGKGAAGFIQKPYTLAMLRERVRSALETGGDQRQV